MGRNQSSRPNKAAVAEQQVRCYEMRLRGASYRDIAANLGISVSTVHKRINAEADARVLPLADALRKQELDRLDDLYLKAYRILQDTHVAHSSGRVVQWNNAPIKDDAPRLAAMDRLLKIMERRAKLLGLDAAQKLDHDGQLRIEIVGVDPDELL